ncbi:glycosyltransferase [Pseudoalteromonas gelatinilytica]
MKLLFCHDHFFKVYKGDFYSQGKLDYSKFEFYLNYFDSIHAIGRKHNVNELSPSLFKSNGKNVVVSTLPNLSSLKGLLNRARAKNKIANLIDNTDVVIVRLPSEIGLIAQKIALQKNKPVLVEVVASAKDCLWYSGSVLKKLYSFILEKRVANACKHASDVIYVTDGYLQKKYPTDYNSYAASDVEIDYVLEGKNWTDKNKYIIGMIGNPDLKIKGAITLYNAVNMLRKKGINAEVRILGGDGCLFKGKYPQTDTEWFTFDGVLSTRNDVLNWLGKIDIYAQPSLTEGLPRSLIEAMSCGIPCTATHVGGIPELISDEYLFSPNSDVALAQILEKLILSEAAYNELSNSCSKQASNYTKEVLFTKRSQCYQNFTGKL